LNRMIIKMLIIAKKEVRPNIHIKDKIKGGGSYKTAAILT